MWKISTHQALHPNWARRSYPMHNTKIPGLAACRGRDFRRPRRHNGFHVTLAIVSFIGNIEPGWIPTSINVSVSKKRERSDDQEVEKQGWQSSYQWLHFVKERVDGLIPRFGSAIRSTPCLNVGHQWMPDGVRSSFKALKQTLGSVLVLYFRGRGSFV